MTTRRERITAEILKHVGEIVAGGELDVSTFSDELREFLRPLSVRQVKSVVLAASKTDKQFWSKFGASLELLLTDAAGPKVSGDDTGLGSLVGDALHQARNDLDGRIDKGLRVLKGGADAA
jgi:hypothetical protein